LASAELKEMTEGRKGKISKTPNGEKINSKAPNLLIKYNSVLNDALVIAYFVQGLQH
jgi:hypothetical protein